MLFFPLWREIFSSAHNSLSQYELPTSLGFFTQREGYKIHMTQLENISVLFSKNQAISSLGTLFARCFPLHFHSSPPPTQVSSTDRNGVFLGEGRKSSMIKCGRRVVPDTKKNSFFSGVVILGNMVSGEEGKCRNANNTRRAQLCFRGSNFRLLLRRSRDLLRLPATERKRKEKLPERNLRSGKWKWVTERKKIEKAHFLRAAKTKVCAILSLLCALL